MLRTYEKKTARGYIETFREDNPDAVWKDLAQIMTAKYLNKSSLYTRTTRRNNYDGTETIIFYDIHNGRNTFIVER